VPHVSHNEGAIVASATCTSCGCLCDDIELHVENGRIVRADRACRLGREWFFGHHCDSRATALVDGRPAAMDDAVEVAAGILRHADHPLIYGLGNSTCESQRAAVLLAEDVGAVIDTHTSLTHGPSKLGAQLVGKVTCTLGEVRNRADLVIYWGTDPVVTHPRHLTRYAYTPAGRFVPRGRHDRTMILVDVHETLSARAADRFLRIQPGTDFELLTVLRAIVRDQPIDSRLLAATGLTLHQATDLVAQMKRARLGVFFFGTGLTRTRGRHMNVAALHSLTMALNAFTKFAAMPMRDLGNDAGADNVLSWLTGYPVGVDFSRGYPRSNPGEFTAAELLARCETDAALIVAADPWSTMPAAAVAHLEAIPHVVIDRVGVSPRPAARVQFMTASPGIDAPGTAFRMDWVPISMRAALDSPRATDEEVLSRIRRALA
jgi:formylmethanofuran dehydrogenase subunit B